MPQAAARSSGNVAAAAALQFSVDFDPAQVDSQPSVLLLTQNVGGIDAAYGGAHTLLDASPGLSPASDQLSLGNVLPSIIASMASPSYAQVPEDVDAESGLPAAVRQHVADLLADLRTWLHRMSFASAAARAAERAAAANVAGSSSSSPSPAAMRHPAGAASGSHGVSGQSVEGLLRGYSPAARPPMVDVVVLHFQEIGGKYKNKQFNRYFREQLSAALLPEAGWTSGLLMDERESDRVVISSSACRPSRVTAAAAAAAAVAQMASPTSMTGHLRAPAWDYKETHSRRSSNDVSGTETDASEEEADPFFTAIGSIIFLSPRIVGVTSCLSVPHRTYIPIADDPITYAGDAGRLFLSGKFSDAGRSRKGFVLVSLRIGTVQFNVCNLHLFNDDDNRVAFEQSPSKYTSRRVRAVQEALAECSAAVDLSEPLFLFGDFNIRLDGKAFLQWAEEKEQITIRAGKKQLRCPDHLWNFFSDPARAAELRRTFDCEPQRLMDEVAVQAKVELGEMPVTFAPTYSRLPYRRRGETAPSAAPSSTRAVSPTRPNGPTPSPRGTTAVNTSGIPSPPPPSSPCLSAAIAAPLTSVVASPTRDNFSHDRLPAWCDRVLFNVAGLEWVAGDRARLAPPPASSAAVRDRRKAEAPHHRWYAYEAVDLVHMDHDGVYLMM